MNPGTFWVKLHHDHVDPTEEQRPYWVGLLWDKGAAPKTIWLEVPPETYNKALDAHRKALPVRVRGHLQDRPGRTVLLNPRDFQVDERQQQAW